jgi:lambda family phage tail tape measure protein
MSNQIIDNLLSGKKAFEDFGDFAMQILAQVLKQLVLVSIISPIGSGIENLISGWFPSAHGNAFDSQRNVIPFATGGVVTRPTVFPFARGTGLMGEAGPEAILPLSRINGELGVKAVGGGGRSSVIINVNNQGNPLQMESQTKRDDPDGETIIDISVRSALDRLDGQGALDSMFRRHGSNRKGVR